MRILKCMTQSDASKNQVPHQNWTREETMEAFCLYLALPQKELTSKSEAVQRLALHLHRTPKAVDFKMRNIAAHDENLIALGRKGMAHTSKLDAQVWDDYKAHGDVFLEECLQLLPGDVAACIQNNIDHVDDSAFDRIVDDLVERTPEGGVRRAVRAVRVNQSYFRNSLVENYQGKCALTGLAIPSLLVASHIKPWAVSDAREKTMASNGILLNVLHDAAFDKGLITFDDDRRMIVSQKAVGHTDLTDQWLYAFEGEKLNKPKTSPPDPSFLAYHRAHIFRGAA